jgi:hypothetical protein
MLACLKKQLKLTPSAKSLTKQSSAASHRRHSWCESKERNLEPLNEQGQPEVELNIGVSWHPGGGVGWTLINPNDFRALCSPGVYIFWRKESDDRLNVSYRGTALYVGSSKRMMSRMCNPRHNQAQQALKECNQISIRFCANELSARDYEQYLIMKLKPKYNVAVRKNISAKSDFSHF